MLSKRQNKLVSAMMLGNKNNDFLRLIRLRRGVILWGMPYSFVIEPTWASYRQTGRVWIGKNGRECKVLAHSRFLFYLWLLPMICRNYASAVLVLLSLLSCHCGGSRDLLDKKLNSVTMQLSRMQEEQDALKQRLVTLE